MGMGALCPSCGLYHEVVRTLEEGHGDMRKDIYVVTPLEMCERTWISDKELFEASARFGQEAIQADPDMDD